MTAPAELEISFRETILQGLAKVTQEQLEFRSAIELLKTRMITKDDVETIITDRLMTRQETKEQRDKDMATWRKSTKYFYSALGGCGCALIVGMLFTSVVSAGVFWAVTHFLTH